MIYTYKQFILRVPTVDNVSNGHFKKCSYRSIEILLELPPSYSGFFGVATYLTPRICAWSSVCY